MKTHKLSTRFMALLLTPVMVIGMLPMTAFAVEAEPKAAFTYEFGPDKTALASGRYLRFV